MPVTHVDTDTDNLTLTITAHFDAPVDRVWDVYADPRKLEQVWGPPTFPATFIEHSLTPGGSMRYYMTSPEGEKFGGWWTVTAVDAPNSFSFDDGFADGDGNPVEGMPVSKNVYAFETDEAGTGTDVTYTATYATAEQLQQVLEMGMEEGATLSINQIDALLAA